MWTCRKNRDSSTGLPANVCPSERPAEGAGLQGGEQGVQFGQVGAHSGFLPLDGFEDGGEAVLKGKVWQKHLELLRVPVVNRLVRRS